MMNLINNSFITSILPDTSIFIPFVIFGVIILLFYAIRLVMDLRLQDESIKKRADNWGTITEKIYEKNASRKEEKSWAPQWLLSILPFTGKNREKSEVGIYSDTPLDFQRAGLYDPVHIRTYRVVRVLLAILPFLAFIIYLRLTGQPIRLDNSFIVFWISGAFFLLPMIWMEARVRKRKQEFEKAFPNAMDLLVVCVEAGMGFDAAIARVSREMEITSPVLAKELKILSLELKTGKSRNICMENLAKRIGLSDVDNLVNLLGQAERFGTGIAHPLQVHAEQMREKRYNRMEELAAKLPVKLSFPLVLFIFPAMMIALVGPSLIMIFRMY